MSGETEANISAWTIDSLRYHLEQIATDLDKRYEQRFEAQEKAVVIQLTARDKEVAAALAAQEKFADERARRQDLAIDKQERDTADRFATVNEFRSQLRDQAALFLTRTEYDANHKSLEARVQEITDRINRSEGSGAGTAQARVNQRLDNGQLIAVVSTLIAAIAIAVTLILALNG